MSKSVFHLMTFPTTTTSHSDTTPIFHSPTSYRRRWWSRRQSKVWALLILWCLVMGAIAAQAGVVKGVW